MRTLLIRIDERPAGAAGYPVCLCVDDGTDDAWLDHPRAEGVIPSPLPAPPESPPGAEPAGYVRDALLAKDASPARLLALGGYLRKLLCAGTVGEVWQGLAGPVGPRTVLDVRPAELRVLPWELLADDSGQMLFADPLRTIVRSSLPLAAPPPAVEVPVRLLVLVGDTSGELKHEEEIAAIHAGLSGAPVRWHIEILDGPGRPDFYAAYDALAPHVLHVIGHGVQAPDTRQPSLRVTEAATGKNWLLSSLEIVNRLRIVPAPRLVVLNACRTTDAAQQGAVLGVASAFERLGSAAVLSMQGDVPSAAAVTFTHRFYAQLAACDRVDVAVARARLDVMAEAGVRAGALPSLSVSVAPELVVTPAVAVTSQELRAVESRPEFEKIRSFVDRTEERRLVLRYADPQVTLAEPTLLLIAGESKIGKSALVRACLHTLRARGRAVVYADLAGVAQVTPQTTPSVSWWDALRVISDEIAVWLPAAGTPARRRFRFELAHLVRGVDPPPLPADPDAPDGDVGAPFAPRNERADEFLGKVFAAFRAMLQAVGGAEPLILVLDRFGTVTPSRPLVDGLLTPVAQGLVKPARLILVDTRDTVTRLLPETVRRQSSRVDVTGFPPQQLARLLREFCTLRRASQPGTWPDVAMQLVPTLAAATPNKWPPGMFAHLEAMAMMIAGEEPR